MNILADQPLPAARAFFHVPVKAIEYWVTLAVMAAADFLNQFFAATSSKVSSQFDGYDLSFAAAFTDR